MFLPRNLIFTITFPIPTDDDNTNSLARQVRVTDSNQGRYTQVESNFEGKIAGEKVCEWDWNLGEGSTSRLLD